jgi:hypothetical protein
MIMSSTEEALRVMPVQPPLADRTSDGGLKRREEAKREAATDPVARWQALQEFLAWAAAQSTAPKMTPAACKAKERRLLAGMAGMFQTRPADE